MKRMTVSERAQAWVVDYSVARVQAIRWLGDRYLRRGRPEPRVARAHGQRARLTRADQREAGSFGTCTFEPHSSMKSMNARILRGRCLRLTYTRYKVGCCSG
jgi:hypothetical protein